MSKLEVSARMTIRKGKLDGFKRQAAECIRQTKEKDTNTLRYDWFVSSDETECEIRQAYQGSEGLIEHRMHIGGALDRLFEEFADAHTVTFTGHRRRSSSEWRMPRCRRGASSGIRSSRGSRTGKAASSPPNFPGGPVRYAASAAGRQAPQGRYPAARASCCDENRTRLSCIDDWMPPHVGKQK